MISFNSPHSQHGANSIWHLFFKYFFSEKLSSHLFELAYLFYKLKNTYQHDYSRQHLYLVQNIWYVHNFWNFFRCKFWSNLTSTIQFIWNNNKKKKKVLKSRNTFEEVSVTDASLDWNLIYIFNQVKKHNSKM